MILGQVLKIAMVLVYGYGNEDVIFDPLAINYDQIHTRSVVNVRLRIAFEAKFCVILVPEEQIREVTLSTLSTYLLNNLSTIYLILNLV